MLGGKNQDPGSFDHYTSMSGEKGKLSIRGEMSKGEQPKSAQSLQKRITFLRENEKTRQRGFNQ